MTNSLLQKISRKLELGKLLKGTGKVEGGDGQRSGRGKISSPPKKESWDLCDFSRGESSRKSCASISSFRLKGWGWAEVEQQLHDTIICCTSLSARGDLKPTLIGPFQFATNDSEDRSGRSLLQSSWRACWGSCRGEDHPEPHWRLPFRSNEHLSLNLALSYPVLESKRSATHQTWPPFQSDWATLCSDFTTIWVSIPVQNCTADWWRKGGKSGIIVRHRCWFLAMRLRIFSLRILSWRFLNWEVEKERKSSNQIPE